MAEILKGDESLNKEGKLDDVGDTNFNKLMEVELGKKAAKEEDVDMVNGVPVRSYLI